MRKQLGKYKLQNILQPRLFKNAMVRMDAVPPRCGLSAQPDPSPGAPLQQREQGLGPRGAGAAPGPWQPPSKALNGVETNQHGLPSAPTDEQALPSSSGPAQPATSRRRGASQGVGPHKCVDLAGQQSAHLAVLGSSLTHGKEQLPLSSHTAAAPPSTGQQAHALRRQVSRTAARASGHFLRPEWVQKRSWGHLGGSVGS